MGFGLQMEVGRMRKGVLLKETAAFSPSLNKFKTQIQTDIPIYSLSTLIYFTYPPPSKDHHHPSIGKMLLLLSSYSLVEGIFGKST